MRPNPAARTVHSLPADGFSGDYPKLPSGHHRNTRRWYETWARSPQAAVFIDTDWQRLQQLAFVVDELYQPTMIATPSGERREQSVTSVLAEIRQQEQKFGATVLDRASLYMTIEAPKDPAASADDEAARRADERRRSMRIADVG